MAIDPGRDRGDPRAAAALVLLRIALALLIAIHGWTRLLAGGVVPFGDWLDGQGLPFGFAIAAAVTALEILGTPLLAWGRLLLALVPAYVLVYLAGIALVHAPAGWFVVGPGRNGMEYSVLLVACLLLVGWQALPRRRGR